MSKIHDVIKKHAVRYKASLSDYIEDDMSY